MDDGVVLDASAILAAAFQEAGCEVVERAIARGAIVSAVNAAEVVGGLVARGWDPIEAGCALEDFDLYVAPLDRRGAIRIGKLRSLPSELGLGLGDRACLDLAHHLGLPALTADRSWEHISSDMLDVKVELIR